MATKETKTMIRINPILKDALKITATTRKISGIQLIEEIVIAWLKENEKGIFKEVKKALKID